jgi:small-conductance mechanosensitive channel
MTAWPEFWGALPTYVGAYGPKLAQLALVFGAHLVFAFLLRFVSFRLVRKFLVFLSRRDSRAVAKDHFDPTARTVSHALFWLVILFGLTGVMEYLGLPVLRLWFEQINRVLPNWIAALFILLFAWSAGNFLRNAVTTSARSAGIAKPEWAGKYARMAVLAVGLLLAVSQAGLNVDFLTYLILILFGTSLLGASIAFGLGAAPFVSNILAGHYIQKQYQVGDWVEIGSRKGRIQRLLPHAVILDTDAGAVTVPSRTFHEEITTLPKGE